MPIIRQEKFRHLREYESEQHIPDSDDTYPSNNFQQSLPFYNGNNRSIQHQQSQPPQQQNPDNNQIITIEDNSDLTKPLSLQFSNHLDRIDRNWRTDPFWRDLYPRWAEPIFKEGIDVKANIVNDRQKFAVDIDAYQFKPEELQVSLGAKVGPDNYLHLFILGKNPG